MKVLVFNCSPRMDKGNTALILKPFLEGLKEAKAEVELFYIKKLKINPCQACFSCWFETPGKCFQKDDMQMLYPKLCQADIWVFATPIYVDSMTAMMKNLIERMIPSSQPFFNLRDGHCRHIARKGGKYTKVVLVSNCGFWEIDNFKPLLVHMKAFCRNLGVEFAGALLRPHGEALRPMMEIGMPVNDIFEAAKRAGYQLIKNDKMSPRTLKLVSRELLPLEMYIQHANQRFQQRLHTLEKK